MRHSFLVLALIALPALAGAASVNGVVIPPDRIEEGVKSMQAQGAKDGPELRQMVTRKLIENELILQEASRRGMDKTPAFQAELANARHQILGRMMVADWAKANPVSDKDIQAEYDRIKGSLSGNEYQVRHIMLTNEADANAVLANLKKGSKFEALAKQKSNDKGSAAQGGMLGWVNSNQFPPTFGAAVKGLGKGQTVKAPVKTEAGWHVIRVEGVRPAKVPPLAEVKENITRQLQSQKFSELLAQLQAKAKIQQ